MKKVYNPQEERAEVFSDNSQMETIYHLTKERMQNAGISIEVSPNGSVAIHGIVSPMQYFDNDFMVQMVREHGERETERILAKVRYAMTSELFMLRFRKMLD